jgi:monoamine oxidase
LPAESYSRRDLLKLSGAAACLALASPNAQSGEEPRPASPRRSAKRVIVAGGGIGGLCCAFELMERGHDVTVIEASGRAGGHVRTMHDPLPDGLYADLGGEHFSRPGYDQFWKYVRKFNLTALPFRRRINMYRRIEGEWYTEEQLRDASVLKHLGLNEREIKFVGEQGWTELASLYLGPYLDKIVDEYKPFGVGLDDLDRVYAADLFARDGASPAAIRFSGLQRGDGSPSDKSNEASALYRIWQAAIVKLRGLPTFRRDVYRLQNGNQTLTDEFARRLGDRVRLGCPVTSIAHGASGVTVNITEFGEQKTLEADYLVSSIPLMILRKIPVTPQWPEEKLPIIQRVRFSTQTRVVLQSRTKFWNGDVPSINLELDDSNLRSTFQIADEVPSNRGVLIGTAGNETTPQDALAAFRNRYPGQRATIEQCYVHNWSKDPWSFGCERQPFPFGQMSMFWPGIMEPVGRIHFAGAYADDAPWGMDAATRSANRVAETIHEL